MVSVQKRAVASLLAFCMIMMFLIGWPFHLIMALAIGFIIGRIESVLSDNTSPGYAYKLSQADRSRLAHERAVRFHNQFAATQWPAKSGRSYTSMIHTVLSTAWLDKDRKLCRAGYETYYAKDRPARRSRTTCTLRYRTFGLAGEYG